MPPRKIPPGPPLRPPRDGEEDDAQGAVVRLLRRSSRPRPRQGHLRLRLRLRRPSDDGSSDGDTGSTGGGYVQDVSPFDRILLAAWEDRFAAGLFRYDVTACKTKVVPGGYGFVAQFNEGRATKKRPTEFSVDEVCQDFDGSKFNFTKADKAEVLFCFENGAGAVTATEFHASKVSGPQAPTAVLINVSPIEYGHVLLCPRVTDCLPQRITPELLLPPLFMAAESRNPYSSGI